ncbi:MAG TPA: bifunctional diaminohydroxyphosphoribosylaminopyrimidine deaminase/5-amino-6-(5-phosphoribosylamino)uracil reductase RibD [Candidatus Parabacteroides intestinavium]|nr:bifunctional diaminohydroxyphosphoribosylaminopyrimidine deaminase/5-amino-6-(5-phosphoribosylamino)uracil reductase RibD [Candidatus Parabacteroides intestinavium]
MKVEEKFMARCIELARHGAGYTAPNPMVGAVVVHNGKIIGEGFHRRCGMGHAEVNALASVHNEDLLREATLYVSLEPCSHYGKTPPCAELIIQKGIPRVVVGCLDPFPEVSGRGIRMLREAGVEVITGIMEQEARALNEAFMIFQTEKRPLVTLKWAESADGFIDACRNSAKTAPITFSTPETRARVHKLRAESAAILVGTRTALLDNPSLSVRYWSGKSPVRLVIDRELKIPSSYHLMDHSVPTLVFTTYRKEPVGQTEYVPLDFKISIVHQILQCLYERKLNSLLVEGGASLLQQFLDSGYWDRAVVEKSPLCIQTGVKAPDIPSGSVRFEQMSGHVFALYTHSRKNNCPKIL